MIQIFGIAPRLFSTLRAGLAGLGLLLCAGVLAQGSVSFEARTESSEFVQGTVFEIKFELKNADGNRFKAPDFKGFRVVSGPSEMRGMTIVNGKSSTQHTWTYQIEAPQVGAFSIGSATVQANGVALQTKPLSIRIVQTRQAKGGRQTATPSGTGGDLFISSETDRDVAYPGQQVTWRVRLYTLVSIEGADLIGLPDFKGFYAKEKRRFNGSVEYVTLRGKKYASKVIHEEALFPQESGELEIGTARVRAGVEQGGALGAFMGPRPVLLQTEPIKITVKPLPDPAPPRFCGGVGQYEWEIQADKDSLSTDDALTITASVRGDGDARRFAAPKLELPPNLEAFEPKIKEEEEYENGAFLMHSKVLEYVVLPHEPGDYTFVPTLVFFDPDSNKYRSFQADKPINIHVTAGKNYASQQAVSDSLAQQIPIAPQPKTFWQRIGGFKQGLFFAGILTLLLFVAFFLWRKKSEPEPKIAVKPPVIAAPRQAVPAKPARAYLNEAGKLLNGGDSRAFYDALFKGIQAFLISKLGIPLAQLDQAHVSARLRSRNVAATKIQQLTALWQSCEEALYSGQHPDEGKEAVWRQAQDLIQMLDQQL